MESLYYIEGATDIKQIKYSEQIPHYPSFQTDLQHFKDLLLDLEKKRNGASFVHFGDGDYFFLKKMAVGSATPGKRALSIPYERFNILPFREGWLKADYYCVEYLEKGMPEKLNELYPGQKTIATEFLYGLIMNKWLLNTFKGRIGLIGAGDKLDVIKELMNKNEYQEYLGLDKFNDYIKIPQQFACDDLNGTVNIVKEQLEKADTETFVYLYGVGHVKSGLIHHLPKIKNAIYLDIGAGIDGLAGLIDPERPYAANWVNYRLKNYNYGSLDLLNYDINKDVKLKWI